MQVAYFVNSGSEANDMAMMMARLYTGNYDILAMRNGYHGLSDATMGMLGHATWKPNVPQVMTQLTADIATPCGSRLPNWTVSSAQLASSHVCNGSKLEL